MTAPAPPMPNALYLAYLFLLGALVGSFLNVVIFRLPEGLSVVRPRSRCPNCGHGIPAWLNIPVVSWLILRGRCYSCKVPISVRYPIVELLTALLFLASGRHFGWSWATLSALILCGSLVAITFIDLDIWEIPDEISLPGIYVGIILHPIATENPWWTGLAGALLGAGMLGAVRWLFVIVRKIEGMGQGDIKLLAMIGAFLGPNGLLPVLLVSSVAGSVIGLLTVLTTSAEEEPPEDGEPQEEPEPLEPLPEPRRTLLTAPVWGLAWVFDRLFGGGLPEEAEEADGDWEPHPRAIPFGPFLALGALFQLFFGAGFSRWLTATFATLLV